MAVKDSADAIAGLSERLRAPRMGDPVEIACQLDDLALEAATQLDSLLKERDALKARVKELEGELVDTQAALTGVNSDWAKAESRALRAEQELNTELQTLKDNGIGSHTEAVVLVVDLRRQLALAQQERDEAYERAIRELQQSYPDHAWLNAACACIRGLSAGPEKEKKK